MLAALGSLGLALSCESPTAPDMPPGAVAMSPAKPYALWWSVVQSCSGRSGDLSAIRWFVVPNSTSITVGGKEYQGYWFERDNTIVLASNAVLGGRLVRHEMLHALSGPTHQREFFVNRCAGVVSCEGDCEKEAGRPAEPASAPTIAASDLILSAKLVPVSPSLSVDGGWMALEVAVTNPLTSGAWATLAPLAESPGFSSTFGFVIACTAGCNGPPDSNYEFIEGSQLGFVAGATRRRVFDIRLGPATYRITGSFNGRTAPPIDVTVNP